MGTKNNKIITQLAGQWRGMLDIIEVGQRWFGHVERMSEKEIVIWTS